MTEMLKRCPMCAEEIMAIARKCKHCGTVFDGEVGTTQAVVRPASDFGIPLLIIPIIATALVWFWVASMNLLQSPGDTLVLILLAVVTTTATLAAVEAKGLGMVSNRDKGTYSPTAWFLIVALIWAIGFPAYLYKRRHYGMANLLVGGVIVMFVFLGSWTLLLSAIEEKRAEILGNIEQVQKSLQSLGVDPNPEKGRLASSPAPAPAPAPAPVVPLLQSSSASNFFTLCSQYIMPNAKKLGGMTDIEALQFARESCPKAEPEYIACINQQKSQDECLRAALPSNE